MNDWKVFLTQFIHMSGFSNDFKPVRKLGGGATATVFRIKDKIS